MGRSNLLLAPHTTLFATNGHKDDLLTTDVPKCYLTRWPKQEHIFRKARNGGGLNHSHGYGGGEVQHVALVSKLEKAESSVIASQKRLDKAKLTRAELDKAFADKPGDASKAAIALADKQIRELEKETGKRQTKLAELRTMPEQISQRDTGRDSIMTCLKMTVMALLEFVLKEYFNGTSMEWRTFIEQLVPLPGHGALDRRALHLPDSPQSEKSRADGTIGAGSDGHQRPRLKPR